MKHLFFFSLLLLSSMYSTAQVTVSGSSSITLDGKADKDTLIVLLAGVDSTGFELQQASPLVRLNGAARKRFSDAVRIEKNNAALGLLLIVDLSLLNTQGSYEVGVPYKTSKISKGLLTFTIIRPAAALESGKIIHIQFEGDDQVLESLALKETTGASGISGLKLDPPFTSAIPSGKLLKFTDSTYHVPAGNYFQANYTVDKNLAKSLPIGTTTGKMVISAPEMATPVEVSFEIIKRRSLWVIFWVTLAGLLFGYLVRVVLQQRKDGEKTRYAGFSLMNVMQEDMNTIADPDFKEDVNAMLSELTRLMQKKGSFPLLGRSNETISAKIAEVQKRYEEMITKLETELKGVKDQFRSLAEALNDGKLSPDIQPVLQNARTIMEQLRRSLQEKNLAGSKKLVGEVMGALKMSANDFKKYLGERISFLSNQDAYPKTYISPATFQQFNLLLEAIRTDGEAMKTDLLKPEESSVLLTTISSVQKRMVDSFDSTVAAIVSDIKKDRSTVFESQSLQETYKNWLQELGVFVHNTGPVHDEQKSDILQLAKELDSKLISVVNNMRQGSGSAEAPSLSWKPVSTAVLINTNFINAQGRKFVEEGLTRSGRSFLLYSFVQTIFLTVILGLAAVKLNAADFTGTTSQLITIFFFAFTIDLTVDGVVAKIKQG